MRSSFLRGAVPVATALLAGSILAGCQAGGQPNSPPPSPEWQNSFNTEAQYWSVSRGLGALGTKLALVSRGQSYNCGGNIMPADSSALAVYCPPTNTVAVAMVRYEVVEGEFVRKGGDPALLRQAIVGHELGHRIQDMFGQFPHSQGATQAQEEQADCLAGEAQRAIAGPTPPEVMTLVYESTGGDAIDNGASHGLAADRTEFYLAGQDEDDAGNPYGCGLRSYAYDNGRIIAGI